MLAWAPGPPLIVSFWRAWYAPAGEPRRHLDATLLCHFTMRGQCNELSMTLPTLSVTAKTTSRQNLKLKCCCTGQGTGQDFWHCTNTGMPSDTVCSSTHSSHPMPSGRPPPTSSPAPAVASRRRDFLLRASRVGVGGGIKEEGEVFAESACILFKIWLIWDWSVLISTLNPRRVRTRRKVEVPAAAESWEGGRVASCRSGGSVASRKACRQSKAPSLMRRCGLARGISKEGTTGERGEEEEGGGERRGNMKKNSPKEGTMRRKTSPKEGIMRLK